MRFLIRAFFFLSVISLLIFIYISVRDLRNSSEFERTKVFEIEQTLQAFLKNDSNSNTTAPNMKYILQWTSAKNVPFVYMGRGQQGFIERNCTYTNCYVTEDRSFLGDYTKFDVIVFAGPQVARMNPSLLPNRRSPHQKFAFASIESADNYPVCSNKFNGFFNWTWTYRLNSEAKWGYIVVRDSDNRIIGPKVNMSWIKLEDMTPTPNEVKEKFKTKTKAAAWFVSNCYSKSRRETFVKDLQTELKKYNLNASITNIQDTQSAAKNDLTKRAPNSTFCDRSLNVDIYGSCGPLSCPRNDQEQCNKMIEKDYYFYLSFENSFAEDYVTEKLLYPLKNYAVPIVYGGANYTRFMPDGIYLNARELGAGKLAKKMDELIKNPDEYSEYFRWRNHYSYYRRVESIETDDYCRFCSILNEEETVKKTTIYQNFKDWWDPPSRC